MEKKNKVGDIIIFAGTGKEKKISSISNDGKYTLTTLDNQSPIVVGEDQILPLNTIYRIGNKVRCKSKTGEWEGEIKSCFSNADGQIFYTILEEGKDTPSTVRKENIIEMVRPFFKYKPGDIFKVDLESLGIRKVKVIDQLVGAKNEPSYEIEYIGFAEDHDVWPEKVLDNMMVNSILDILKRIPRNVILYSRAYGDVTYLSITVDKKINIHSGKETKIYDAEGKLSKKGNVDLYPNEELFRKYPFDGYKAWEEYERGLKNDYLIAVEVDGLDVREVITGIYSTKEEFESKLEQIRKILNAEV